MNTFEVNDPLIQQKLKDLGTIIAASMPPEVGFTLLIFPFLKTGGIFYISNAERESMIKALEELIWKLKGD
jgi:hypothetical protein